MTRRLRPCIEPNCPALTPATRCPAHQRVLQAAEDQRYNPQWRRLSRQARTTQPWCTRCHRSKAQLDALNIRLSLDHETGTVECQPCNSAHRRNVGEVRAPDVIR